MLEGVTVKGGVLPVNNIGLKQDLGQEQQQQQQQRNWCACCLTQVVT
jgi:hypothetical protein